MDNFLYDKNFLKKLDCYPLQEKYVKIIALDFNDLPKETIEGKITGGNINIDGSSTVRRTCSLTLAIPLEQSEDDDSKKLITDSYWCFNTKINIKIGLRNYIDNEYPSIVWFDMGIYLLTSFSASKSTNNLNVSLSGKDKMCRLNGEVGGIMPSEWNWGQEEYNDLESGVKTITKIPLKTIVYNIVREIAQERPENIIVRDLDDCSYELWGYNGNEPLYYLRNSDTGNIHQVKFNQNSKITTMFGSNDVKTIKISELEEHFNDNVAGKYYSTNTLDPSYNEDASVVVEGTKRTVNDFNATKYKYNVIRISKKEVAGYHPIPLVFNDDLIAKVGETATSVLDKIKNILGNFEYFYNEKGQFVFQKKNDYVQELYSTSSGALTTPMVFNDIYSYRFEDEAQFTAISNAPNLTNIKNDFIVWGALPNTKEPIHARCAIDKKPTSYTSPWQRIYRVGTIVEAPMRSQSQVVEGYGYKKSGNFIKNTVYEDTKKDSEGKKIGSIKYNFSALKSFSSLNGSLTPGVQLFEYRKKEIYKSTDQNNGKSCWRIVVGTLSADSNNVSVKITYEIDEKEVRVQYVTWKISQTVELLQEYDKYLYVELKAGRVYSTSSYDWRELIYQMAIDYRQHGTDPDYYVKLETYNPNFLNGKTGYESYYIDIEGFWRQLYNPTPQTNISDYYRSGNKRYWTKKIHSDPNSILFWFEFFDTQGELQKYSIQNIGPRQKVINENTVTSIYHKEIPEVQFYVSGEDWQKEANTAYTPIQITPQDELLFYKHSQGASAIERINDLMFNYLSMAEGISLTTIPIYYLQTNTRIYVANNGDYTVNRISYNLNYNGTMTISASKIYKQWI